MNQTPRVGGTKRRQPWALRCLPFQGSYKFRKSNLDKLGLQPQRIANKRNFQSVGAEAPTHMFIISLHVLLIQIQVSSLPVGSRLFEEALLDHERDAMKQIDIGDCIPHMNLKCIGPLLQAF
jgi:hypothetical protein